MTPSPRPSRSVLKAAPAVLFTLLATLFASAAAAQTTIDVPGAVFPMPSDWKSETPSSQMRLAQARVPGPGGDGQLTVFFFGAGGGGGVDANLQRWVGQVEASGPATGDVLVVGTWRVSWVEVAGTLKPSTMGGSSEPQPNSRLLGAVVEGEGGPWFFKLTGPASTVEAERDNFFNMLKSGRPQG